MNLRNEYWKRVRIAEHELGDVEFVYLTSIEDPYTGRRGGVLCEANKETAAIFITKQSHRVSTKEEVEGFLAEQGIVKEKAYHGALAKAGKAVVTLPKSGQ